MERDDYGLQPFERGAVKALRLGGALPDSLNPSTA